MSGSTVVHEGKTTEESHAHTFTSHSRCTVAKEVTHCPTSKFQHNELIVSSKVMMDELGTMVKYYYRNEHMHERMDS